MGKPPPSITDQIRAALASVGSQAEVFRRIEAAGGHIRKATLSDLSTGQRPSLEALVLLAKATGYRFEITGETEIGTSRASRPSEEAEAAPAPKRRTRAGGGA